MSGKGVTERACRLDIHLRGFCHHPAEKGNIKAVIHRGAKFLQCRLDRTFRALGIQFVFNQTVNNFIVLGTRKIKQSIISQGFGNFRSQRFLFGLGLFKQLLRQNFGYFFRANAESDAQIMKLRANSTLPALRAHADTGDSTDCDRFRAPHIISIKT